MPDNKVVTPAGEEKQPDSSPTLVVVWGHDGPVSVQLVDSPVLPTPGPGQCPDCGAPQFTVWKKMSL